MRHFPKLQLKYTSSFGMQHSFTGTAHASRGRHVRTIAALTNATQTRPPSIEIISHLESLLAHLDMYWSTEFDCGKPRGVDR